MKQILKLAALALAMSTALPSAPSNAAEATEFTPAQQARIGEIAADYLVAHPDVLIEVSKKLQARQQAMQQQAYVQSALKAHRLLMQLDGVPVKRRRQPSMRLLGLLHLLWEQSGINVWHPAFDRKKRYPGWVSWRLNETAGRIRIGRIPLRQSLMLMAMKDSPQVAENRRIAKEAAGDSRRLIMISQLAAWSDAADERLQYTLPLGLFAGFPSLDLPDDVRARLSRSFTRELSDWRRGARVMIICETEPPETAFIRKDGRNVPRSSCRVIDAALMTVSPRYIPLDSRYEGLVEARMWEEKRTFIKPLRYDGEEDVFPDFVLTDVAGTEALPMEVFGMNTPDYLQRKQVKTALYDRDYGEGRWWQWDASADPEGQDMPDFP